MTKPRKEQVRNLKTNYKTVLSSEWNYSSGSASQTIIKNDTGSGNYYLNGFLSRTLTGVVDGADENCPAYIHQIPTVSGPWTVTAGNSFTIRMSGLNSNNPMSVVIQSGDLVAIGGVMQLTTFALVDRINTAITAVTGTSAVAAFSDRGRISIRSIGMSGPNVGSGVSMTITDVTAGLLSLLGLSTSTSLTVYGKDASTRGVVTSSADGLGGYIEIRESNGASVYPSSEYMVRDVTNTTNYLTNVPENRVGSPVHGRVRYIPGPINDGRSLEISAWSQYSDKARLIIRRPNIAALVTGDYLSISLQNAPSFGSSYAFFTANFTTLVNPTMSQIVEQINAGWANSLQLFPNPRLGCVQLTRGPYSFPVATGFRFGPGFNTLATVSFSAGEVLTENQLLVRLQSAVTTAGLGSQITLTLQNWGIRISVTSPSSGLYIRPLNGGNAQAMETVGVAPGVYRGVEIASLYGADAIQIVNPLNNSAIEWETLAQTANKLGISTSGSVSSAIGIYPLDSTLIISKDLSVPESLEFWEVPDDIAADDRQFLTAVKPQNRSTVDSWVSSAGLSPLLGPNLKIPYQFLPTQYTVLSAGQIQFFPTLDSLVPCTVSSHSSASWRLFWESIPDQGSTSEAGPVRLYSMDDGFNITFNARRTFSGMFTSDAVTPNEEGSHLWSFKGRTLSVRGRAYSASPFNTWTDESLEIDSLVEFPHVSTMRNTLVLNGANATIDTQRMSIPRGVSANPTGNQKYTLVFQSLAAGSGAILPLRFYISHSVTNSISGGSINGFMFTVNAKWSSSTGTWARDVPTDVSTAWTMTRTQTIGGLNTRSEGFGMLLSKTASWLDTEWTKTGYYSYNTNDLNGVFSTLQLHGKADVDFGGLNSIRAENTIRSWGRIAYASPPVLLSDAGPPATPIQYNVASASRTATGVYNVVYSLAVGPASSVVISSSAPVDTVAFTISATSSTGFTCRKAVSGTLSDTSYQGSHITLGQVSPLPIGI